MKDPVKVGIIGCGNIAPIYLKNGQRFHMLDVVACCDLDTQQAKKRAEEYSLTKVCTLDEMLADPDIEVILNLTPPSTHADIALRALEAGKSIYNEKPLAIEVEDGRNIVETARKKGLFVGCAPDTFLGAGHQTVRKLLEEGKIGDPIGATACMMSHGMEHWHPNPEFFYQHGGGPLFDVGVYYMTALVHLLGPVRRVAGSARISFPERTISSEPLKGTSFKVNTPTHISGVMDFESGAIATVLTSFDVWGHHHPALEIYGTLGTISVPNPNTFGGPVSVKIGEQGEWEDIPLTHPYSDNSRGIGLADMAYAMRNGRGYRATGDLALHVLEVMAAFSKSSQEDRYIHIQSRCERPKPFPTGLEDGHLDN